MVSKCANSWCPTPRHKTGGKLFRLDIDLGSKSGVDERMTEYLWLCDACAEVMHPKVEVSGDTVKLCLTKNEPITIVDSSARPVWKQAN